MTTEAVLWPTPGSSSSAANVRGTLPLCLVMRSCERREIARDLVGERPTGRMMAAMSAGSRAAIFSGVSAFAKSAGVHWLTRASVLCAERRTAIRSVKGSLCCSGMSGWGKSSSSFFAINAARSFLFISGLEILKEYSKRTLA